MKLGEKISQARQTHHLTQFDVAKHFHVSRKTISHWENEQSYPDIDSLIEISNFYGISIDKMLKEDDSMKKALNPDEVIRQFNPIIKGINIINVICIMILLIGIFNHFFAMMTLICTIILIANFSVMNKIDHLKFKVKPITFSEKKQHQLKEIKILIPTTIAFLIATGIAIYFNLPSHSKIMLVLVTILCALKLISTGFNYRYELPKQY